MTLRTVAGIFNCKNTASTRS